MASNDGLPDQRANLIAAAHAAASWARARRATWTEAPPAVLATPPEDETSRTPAEAERHVPSDPPAAVPPPLPPVLVAIPRTGPALATRAAKRVRALGTPVLRWLPRVVAAVVLLAASVAGGLYLWNVVATSKTRIAVREPAPVGPTETKRKATGGLRVSSTPVGARVSVDGKMRGVTPLALEDLNAGRHTIEIKSEAGTVQRTVTVAADQTAEVNESIFSGWLAVYSPFDLVITEGGRGLRLDDRNQIMLPPGHHELRLANRALGYEDVRQVDLTPGEVTTLSLKPPPSTLTVTATEPADVWLDNARVGETPLNALPVELGSHDIVVRRAAGGERRFTVTITVRPFTLDVDFSKLAF